jgi:hypothetical protein
MTRRAAGSAAGAFDTAIAGPPSPGLQTVAPLVPPRAPRGKIRRFEMVLAPAERSALSALATRVDVAIRGAGADEGVPVSMAEVLRALLGEALEDAALADRATRRIAADRLGESVNP